MDATIDETTFKFKHTFHGFPGSNSGTKSVNAAAGDCCADGQSLFSLSGVVSGHPSLTLRPDDQVLYKSE